jgi:putative endopeptidase
MKKILNLSILASGCALLFTQCASNSTPAQEVENPVAFDTADMKHHLAPCEDFYTYSIGTWQENNPVPSTESRWMSFNILADKNREKLQAILDETASLKDLKKGSPKQQIRDLYLSALDSAGREETGMKPLEPIIADIQSMDDVMDMHNLVIKYRPIGLGGPYGFYVGRDRKNSELYVVSASQSGLNLPDRDYYLKTDEDALETQKKYISHINKMFALAGLEEQPGQDIFDFEKGLAEISMERSKMRIPELTYNRMDLKVWDEELTNIPVSELLTGFGLENVDTLVVSTLDYFTSLNTTLEGVELSTVKQYLTWELINTYASHLGDDLVNQNFEFYGKTLSGTKEMKSKKERILRMVDGQLGNQLGELFVEKHFPEESKKYMSVMIENLRAAYKESIQNLTWMSDSTKEKAMKKLESFTYKIGYPDKWKDYTSIDIQPDKYLNNIMNIRKFGFNYMIERLGKPVDKDEWFMKPQMVNAYYSPSNNEIVFPAGILQPPFFHPTFDDAINYGGIGGVIGHEFTHGFDDQGSKYDWNGNLNNWWTPEDRERFDALTTQLAEQYDQYEALPGKFVNGRMTLGENIADLGGVTLAFAALKKQLDGNEPAPIDGLTWQQRFFLGWANVWKGNITEKELEKRLLTDYHSPAHFRVLGPLSNTPEFYEAFGCKDGAMVKPDTAMIKIW